MRTIRAWMRERRRRFGADLRGGVAVAFALAAIPVIGVVGLGVDYTRATNARTALQANLDMAVLAGLRAEGDHEAAAQRAFDAAQRGPVDSRAFTLGADGALHGRASLRVDTTMAGLLGFDEIRIGAEAEAFRAASTRVCLLLLDQTASQTLLVNGNTSVRAPACEVHVRTRASTAAIFNGGSVFDVARVCLAGPGYIANGRPQIGPVETRCNAAQDTIAGTLPAPDPKPCTHRNAIFNGGGSGPTRLQPGVYCGNTTFNGNHDIVLEAGLYEIRDGSFIVNGNSSLTGTGVTFHLANERALLQLNGQARTRLSAPTSGNLAGVLIYEPTGIAQRSPITINGGTGQKLEGLLYLPSRNVTFNGATSIDSDSVTMIFNSLIMNGTSSWRFGPSAHALRGGGSGGELVLRR